MSEDWRNEPATEEQKHKLRFFGCTWDDGITAGQASDAIEECAKQFPGAEAAYQKSLPATERQKEKLNFFGCTWNGDITVGEACDALVECTRQFPDKEADWQFQKKKWSKVAGSFPATLQREAPVTTAPAKNPQTQRSFHVLPRRVTTIKSPMLPGNNSVSSKPHDEAFSEGVPISKAESVESEMPDGSVETPQQYLERKGRSQDQNWQRWGLDKAKQASDFLSKKTLTYDAARQMGEKEWHEWIGLHGSYGTEPGHKLTYGDARKLSEREWNNWSVSHGRQVARQSDTVGDQPAAPVFIPPTPEQFAEIRSFGKVPPKGLTFQEATTWIEQLKIFFAPKTGRVPPEPQTVERHDWRTAPASEKQKEKLRLLGCTFDDGITVGIAKLLIECHKAESEISHPSVRREGFFSGDNQPETRKTEAASCQSTKEWDEWFALQERIKKRSIPFDELPAQEVTIREVEVPTPTVATPVFIPPTPEQLDDIRSFGQTPPSGLTFQEAKIWIEQCKLLYPAKPQNICLQENLEHKYTPNGFCKNCGWERSFIEKTQRACLATQESKSTAQEVTIQEAAKPQNTSPREIIPEAPKDFRHHYEMYCPACDGQIQVPQGTIGNKRACPHCQSEIAPVFTRRSPQNNVIPAREVQEYARQKTPEKIEVDARTVKEPKRPKYLPYPREPRHTDSNSSLDFDYANWMKKALEIETENQRRHDVYCAAIKSWYAKHNWKMDWEPQPFPKSPLRQNTSSQEVTIQQAAKPQIRRPTTYNYHGPIERFSEWVDNFLERNQTCLGGHWLPAGPLSYVFGSEAISIGLCRQVADTIESKGYCVEPDARFGSGTYDRNQTLALFKPLDDDPIQPSAAYLGAANLLRLCILIASADGRIDIVELDVFRKAIENQIGLSLTDHKRLLILEQLLAQELCSAAKTIAKIAKSVPADKRLVIGKLLVRVAAANLFITNEERRVLERIFKAFEIQPETLEKLVAQICPSQWSRPDSNDVSKNDKWLWNHWRTGHPGVVIDDTTLAGKTWNFNNWKALNARWRDFHERLVARQKQSSQESTIQEAEDSPSYYSQVTQEQLDEIRLFGYGEKPTNALFYYGAAKKWIEDCKARENSATSQKLNAQEARTTASSEPVPKKVSWVKEFLATGRMPGASGKETSKPIASPAPKKFTLDMEKVYAITSETKEVVAILSVLMEDESENSITLPNRVAVPVSAIQKVASDGNATSQPTRFNGLDAAFHPILERLLARDSWSKNDFKSLADEFHFMPSKIHDTLNEWSDEVLGDFILDGEDPVIIHRELIAKETIYG